MNKFREVQSEMEKALIKANKADKGYKKAMKKYRQARVKYLIEKRRQIKMRSEEPQD